MTRPTVSRISDSIATRPPNSGSKQVHDAAQLAAGERRVVGDARDAGLPRQVERRPVVPRLVEEPVLEVDPVGDAVERELLDPAEVLQPGRHPVRRADDVVVDDPAGAEHRREHPVVDLVVVVEVLVVGGGDPGGLGEPVDRAHGAVLAGVDVRLPVEDAHVGVARADTAGAVATTIAGRVTAAVAGEGEDAADHDRRAGDGATDDERPPSEAAIGRRGRRRSGAGRGQLGAVEGCLDLVDVGRRRADDGRATAEEVRRVRRPAQRDLLAGPQRQAARRRCRRWPRPRCRRRGRRSTAGRSPGRSRA